MHGVTILAVHPRLAPLENGLMVFKERVWSAIHKVGKAVYGGAELKIFELWSSSPARCRSRAGLDAPRGMRSSEMLQVCPSNFGLGHNAFLRCVV